MRHGPGPCGNVRSGWPGAKTPTTGTPNAAATCSGPESWPTNADGARQARRPSRRARRRRFDRRNSRAGACTTAAARRAPACVPIQRTGSPRRLQRERELRPIDRAARSALACWRTDGARRTATAARQRRRHGARGQAGGVERIARILRLDAERAEQPRLLANDGLVYVFGVEHVREKGRVAMSREADAHGDSRGRDGGGGAPRRLAQQRDVVPVGVHSVECCGGSARPAAGDVLARRPRTDRRRSRCARAGRARRRRPCSLCTRRSIVAPGNARCSGGVSAEAKTRSPRLSSATRRIARRVVRAASR